MDDVPSVLVVWSDKVNPELLLAHRYYPLPRCSMVMAEDHLLKWYRDRRCMIVAMDWGWGEEPRLMPKSRLVPAPLPTGLHGRAGRR